MVSGVNAPMFAYNVETVEVGHVYKSGIMVMPLSDEDVVGVPLDNWKMNNDAADVTIPSQVGGQWCNTIFAKITSPSDANVSRIAGLSQQRG